MRIFLRPLSAAAGSRSAAIRATLLATALLAFGAAPAHALVVEVGATHVGLMRHSEPAKVLVEEALEPLSFANPSGNPVLHSNSTYIVYWDPGDRYNDNWQHVIDGFMQNMSLASGSLATTFAVDTQYTDKTNKPAAYKTAFRSSSTDTAPYPAPLCTDPNPLEEGDAITCLTDKQVREQLESYVAYNHLPRGMGSIYYVLTPPGVAVCLDEGSASHCSSNAPSANSFCSYHAAISPTNAVTGDGNTLLYGVIPWSAGGYGDPLLHAANRTRPVNCQDGGFEHTAEGVIKKEAAKTETAAEKKHFEEADAEEKQKLKREKELEGPHQQQPNQELGCPNVYDGGCDTGLADVIITQIGSEQNDIVTDPLLNAWQDSLHNEVVDECRNLLGIISGGEAANQLSGGGFASNQQFAGGSYLLNDVFNAAALHLPQPGGACLHHANLAPEFTAPTPVNSGELVGLDGMESNVALNAGVNFPGGGAPATTYATYSWSFGDGSAPVTGYAPGAPACETPWLSPCAASAFHSYQYGGTYPVTLTVTDVGGNVASVTHPITVVGPAPPSENHPGGGSGGSGGSSGSAASTSAGSTSGSGASTPKGGHVLPAPVAAQAVLTHSLRSVLRNGLVVSYAVNEQVAGHFEVLMARSVASRLGVPGIPASGLPAGTPPQVVIGKALLVTTEGGRSTVRIVFSKRVHSHLAHAHRVSLMLRLVVRNGGQSPTSATVLSTFTLS